jgi:putative transposase
MWIDATYLKVREAGCLASIAVIIAVAVNPDGVREVLGMAIGPSEAEPFWTSFLRSLMRRGLRGVKLVILHAHVGIKAAVATVLESARQLGISDAYRAQPHRERQTTIGGDHSHNTSSV